MVYRIKINVSSEAKNEEYFLEDFQKLIDYINNEYIGSMVEQKYDNYEYNKSILVKFNYFVVPESKPVIFFDSFVSRLQKKFERLSIW
jgi:hypothetical protein